MRLHCTEKLAAKLKSLPAVADDAGDSALGAWHANLIRVDRVQCVLFCHDETRFCLFLPNVKGPQWTDLGRLHGEIFSEVLAAQGVPDAAIECAKRRSGPLIIDRATNRSVLALINRATQDIEGGYRHGLAHLLEMHPIKIARWLNERPTTIAGGDWMWPEALMAERVSQLGAG
jgi:hypothetical protein